MVRNFIVGAFEAFAWVFLFGAIAYCTYFGYRAAEIGVLHAGPYTALPWQGAVAGFLVGSVAGIVVTGLIFTLLDIRAGTDRITALMEEELRRRWRGDDGDRDDD